MEHQKETPARFMINNPLIAGAALLIIASGISMERMSFGTFDGSSIYCHIHASLLLFFLLILAQRSIIIAYLLVPAILCFWFLFDYAYDIIPPPFEKTSDYINTQKAHLRNLYYTYLCSSSNQISMVLAAVLSYGGIYCVRRFLSPVHLYNSVATWIVAGSYTTLSLLLLPAGLIRHC